MKTIATLLLSVFLPLLCLGQSERVVTYPIELIYRKHLRQCLEPYNVSLEVIKKYSDTFISTLEFVDRFKSHCDPKIFEFYTQRDKQLWEIDLQVSRYFDSLSVIMPPLYEVRGKLDTVDIQPRGYIEKAKLFKSFAQAQRGKLYFVDYSGIGNTSKRLEADLVKAGLRKVEAVRYIELLK